MSESLAFDKTLESGRAKYNDTNMVWERSSGRRKRMEATNTEREASSETTAVICLKSCIRSLHWCDVHLGVSTWRDTTSPSQEEIIWSCWRGGSIYTALITGTKVHDKWKSRSVSWCCSSFTRSGCVHGDRSCWWSHRFNLSVKNLNLRHHHETSPAPAVNLVDKINSVKFKSESLLCLETETF